MLSGELGKCNGLGTRKIEHRLWVGVIDHQARMEPADQIPGAVIRCLRRASWAESQARPRCDLMHNLEHPVALVPSTRIAADECDVRRQ